MDLPMGVLSQSQICSHNKSNPEAGNIKLTEYANKNSAKSFDVLYTFVVVQFIICISRCPNTGPNRELRKRSGIEVAIDSDWIL